MTSLSSVSRLVSCAVFALAASAVLAEPMREWDWHMPSSVYKELDFTDRAGVDRAVKLFESAIYAERCGKRVTDLVPMYRLAAGEWRKVQVQAETAGGNESLLAYAIFMQGYAKQQARDRNESIKLYNEVLDLYPEEKFVAIPARYMLSNVKRQIGDVKQADAEIEAIVTDGAAEGHVLYFIVIRELAAKRWSEGREQEAAELWEKIVFSKANIDWNLRSRSRDDLAFARLVGHSFGNLLDVLVVGVSGKPEEAKRRAISDNANWFSDVDNPNHGVARYLDAKYPAPKKTFERKKEFERLRKDYFAWFEQESEAFKGVDDGWTVALLRFRLYRPVEKKEEIQKRIGALGQLVRSAKPDEKTARARTLAFMLVSYKDPEGARSIAALPSDILSRLWLQYEIECALYQWKMAVMYLEQFINSKPAPAPNSLTSAKWKLAEHCRRHLGTPERAIKIYQDINQPPGTLWALAETYRECGKKKESYQTLVEITSIFPNDAPNAVFRTAQWKEQDGEKEKAISLYRQIMKHPKWKQTGASSQAHQALERLGVATGGAMTNQVR